MFAKRSLKSFIYELSKTICKKHGIEKVEIFHILTDSDRTSLKFIFFSDQNSDVPDRKFRDVIFEVRVASKIYKRYLPCVLECFWCEKTTKTEKKLVIMRMNISKTSAS